jgi:hypothetical protein
MINGISMRVNGQSVILANVNGVVTAQLESGQFTVGTEASGCNTEHAARDIVAKCRSTRVYHQVEVKAVLDLIFADLG